MNNLNLTPSSHKSITRINPLLKIGGQFFSAAAIASMISTPFLARANTNSRNNIDLNLSDFSQPAIIQIENNLPKPNFEMISYKIKDGDVLGRIAQKFGVKMSKIMELNPEIPNKDTIKAGSIIQIPCRYKLLSQKFPKVKAKKNISEIAKVPEELKKEILSVDSNIKSLITYLGIFKKGDLLKIQNSNFSQDEKNGAILDLFLEDSKKFKEKPVVQEINELRFDDGIEKNISKILSKGGYDGATVYNLLSTVTKVETSGGNFYDSVKAAQNTTNDERRNYYIKQAVKRSLGGSNDCGPFQITPGWLKSEIKESGVQFNGKINENTDFLREKLTKTFTQAISEGLNQQQTKELLIKTDCRFDTEKMAKFVLSNFIRNYKQIDSKARDLSCSNKTKLALMAYNVGIGGALNRCSALLDGAKSSDVYNTADIKLRHHILQVSSIENKISGNSQIKELDKIIPQELEKIEEKTPMMQDKIILAKNPSKEVFRVLGNGTIDFKNNSRMSVSHVNLFLDETGDNKALEKVVDDNKNRVRYLTSDVLKILTRNVFDPKYNVSARVKKEVISKLSKDPIGVMKANIKLQREKAELGDMQAMRNAQGLQDLLDKCLIEISTDIPTYNKIAA